MDIKLMQRQLQSQIKETGYSDEESASIARILLENYYSVSYTQLTIGGEVQVTSQATDLLNAALGKLQQGFPVQYAIGKANFYGREFMVNEHVLIPRPETEELVHHIVKNNPKGGRILDIGTGSGCIPITLWLEMENCEVNAIDVSETALQVAKSNAKHFNADINLSCEDILKASALPKSYDIIVSNPPYVRMSEKELMENHVINFEPELALYVSDEDPLLFYRKITQLAGSNLIEGGKLYFEINEAFGKELIQLVSENSFQSAKIIQDMQNKDRILEAIK